MKNLVFLLQEKNDLLRELYGSNFRELKKIKNKNFCTLGVFYQNRERLLRLMGELDFLLQDALMADYTFAVSASEKRRLDQLLKSKNRLVRDIVNIDIEIIETVDKEKINVLKGLRSGLYDAG